MKNTMFLLVFAFGFTTSRAQSTEGLIAHWDMNGSTNDVTGNGHNGNGNNITAVAGENGVANTAYYFNGYNSIITAPYMSDLNASKLTICAIVKVMGFYSGSCQDNLIFMRGDRLTSGSYVLDFSDNNLGGSDPCDVYDTSEDVFGMACGPYSAPSLPELRYFPTISENIWYNIVATFDDTTFKIYVNGILKNSYTNAGAFVGTSTDSISIGYDLFEAAGGYPFPFNGIIDDIMIYNRVLSDSEITIYSTPSGIATIKNEPIITVYPNPTQNIINVELPYTNVIVPIQLINEIGQVLMQKSVKSKITAFDLSLQPPGLYVLKVPIDGEVIYKKILRN